MRESVAWAGDEIFKAIVAGQLQRHVIVLKRQRLRFTVRLPRLKLNGHDSAGRSLKRFTKCTSAMFIQISDLRWVVGADRQNSSVQRNRFKLGKPATHQFLKPDAEILQDIIPDRIADRLWHRDDFSDQLTGVGKRLRHLENRRKQAVTYCY